MERCGACGAALAADAAWCGQCFARVDAATPAAAAVGFRPAGTQPREVLTRPTRWQKTPTTFGPIGRLAATFGVMVPLLVMIVGGFVDVFAWGGAAFYAAVIVPWAMRDIWREGRVPVT